MKCQGCHVVSFPNDGNLYCPGCRVEPSKVKLSDLGSRIGLDVPNLPPCVTVSAENTGDRIEVRAALRAYSVCSVDAGSPFLEVDISRAVDQVVDGLREYARWGRDIGDVFEVAPHLGIRISFQGRVGVVIQRDNLKHTARVRWDDGEETALPFFAFARADMELAKLLGTT